MRMYAVVLLKERRSFTMVSGEWVLLWCGIPRWTACSEAGLRRWDLLVSYDDLWWWGPGAGGWKWRDMICSGESGSACVWHIMKQSCLESAGPWWRHPRMWEPLCTDLQYQCMVLLIKRRNIQKKVRYKIIAYPSISWFSRKNPLKQYASVYL